jgi:CHAD domain-containing protein
MAKAKKWEIKKLQKKHSLKKTSQIVLKNRLNAVTKSIAKYIADNTVENLHSMRIAIRRLRYGMEIFLVCFEKKKYLAFYDLIVGLQDQSGLVRDLDILIENVNKLKTESGIKNLTEVEKEIFNKKEILTIDLETKLRQFVENEIVKDFKIILA